MIRTEEALEQSQAMNQLLLEMAKSQKENNKATVKILIIFIVCYTLLLMTLIIGFLWYESQLANAENPASKEASYRNFELDSSRGCDYNEEFLKADVKQVTKSVTHRRRMPKSISTSKSHANGTLSYKRRVC